MPLPQDVQSRDLPPQLGLLWGQIVDAMHRMEVLTAGMKADELGYRGPTGTDNSTATLLTHLADSSLGIAQHLLGVTVPSEWQRGFRSPRDAEGRLPIVATSALTVESLLERLWQAQGFIRQAIAGLSETDLDRVVPVWGGHDGTLRWVLWHVAEHNILHQGHIRILRRQWREGDILPPPAHRHC